MSPAESFVLDKIIQNKIRVNESGEVEMYHDSYKKFVLKKAAPHHVSGRLRYKFGETRGWVYKSRLVWMCKHRTEIPEGFVVDHIDEDKNNNSSANLRLMTQKESNEQGGRIYLDRTLARLQRWFEFVGKMGREPQSEQETYWVEWGF